MYKKIPYIYNKYKGCEKMKKITNKQYSEMVDKITPPSSLFIKSLRAFVTGGGFCLVAQIFFNALLSIGIKEINASTFTSMADLPHTVRFRT